LSEVSNLDLLEQKIGDTLLKLVEAQKEKQELSRQNAALEMRIHDLESENRGLQASMAKLKQQLDGGAQNGRDLVAVREKVQGILAKFERLDL
jgi:chaperonin cofactor prefoldin